MTHLNVTVFGASGATGQRLVSQALEHGHRVRAVCRPSSQLSPPPGVEVVRGGFDDRAFLASSVSGADAVFCALGQRPHTREPFCAAATRAILEAMTQEHVDRFACLTGAMIAPVAARLTLPARTMAALFGRFVPEVAADRAFQEALVRESGLSWTLFKPPRLTNGPRTGRVRSGTDLRVGLLSSITRADLAEAMLHAVEQQLSIRQAIYLCAAA